MSLINKITLCTLVLLLSSCSYFSEGERFPFFSRSGQKLGKYKMSDVQRARLNLDMLTGITEVATSVPNHKVYRANSRSRSDVIEFLPPFDLIINDQVQRELNYYQNVDRRVISLGIERRKEFYPMIREVFLDEGVPAELLSIAHIESGYNTLARSPAGAVGMWQFMKPTARHYGIKINLVHDQRKDPIYSSIAAARHLKDLYKMFGDWYLAVAAYNAGSGTISQALKRSSSRSFWELCRRGLIRQETQRFVPKIIAVALIDRFPWRYGFDQKQNQQA
jgi:hypothetical protein